MKDWKTYTKCQWWLSLGLELKRFWFIFNTFGGHFPIKHVTHMILKIKKFWSAKNKNNNTRIKPLYLELFSIPNVTNSCVRQSKGSPKMSRSHSLGLVHMLLSMAKGTLQMWLSWGFWDVQDYPGLTWWTPCNHEGLIRR